MWRTTRESGEQVEKKEVKDYLRSRLLKDDRARRRVK